MERVQGVTLADWLKRQGPMPLGPSCRCSSASHAVVQTAHECGIVHRDLKPSNVMIIERAGELLPKLLDFGVAKLLDSASPRRRICPTSTTRRCGRPRIPAGNLDAARPPWASRR